MSQKPQWLNILSHIPRCIPPISQYICYENLFFKKKPTVYETIVNHFKCHFSTLFREPIVVLQEQSQHRRV